MIATKILTTKILTTYDIVSSPSFRSARFNNLPLHLDIKKLKILTDDWFNNTYIKKDNQAFGYCDFEPVELISRVIKHEADLKTSPHKLDVVIVVGNVNHIGYLKQAIAKDLGCKKDGVRYMDTYENAEIYFASPSDRHIDGRFTNLFIWYGIFDYNMYDFWLNTTYIMARSKYFYFLRDNMNVPADPDINYLKKLEDSGVEMTSMLEWTEKEYIRALRAKKLRRILK